MTNRNIPDVCVGRIVVEFSKKYITLFLCNDSGRVLDWDAFNHDSPLEAEVATEERDNFFHILYDYSNTIVNMSEDIERGTDERQDDSENTRSDER